MNIISSSLRAEDAHLTMQTHFMRYLLTRRDKDHKTYQGGLIYVTYKFFDNGYLFTTSMFDEVLMRWVPIMFSWIYGLEPAHHKVHFETLLREIQASDLNHSERNALVQQVVDFSNAQKKGFIEAYMGVFNESDRMRALEKLHGCHEHFRAAVTRIKRNRSVVSQENEVRHSSGLVSPICQCYVDQSPLFPFSLHSKNLLYRFLNLILLVDLLWKRNLMS